MSDNLCKKYPMTGGRWENGGPPSWSRTWSRYKPPCVLEVFTKEQLDMRRKAYVLNYNQRNGRPKKKDAYVYFSNHPKNRNRSTATTAKSSNMIFNKAVGTNIYKCNPSNVSTVQKSYPTTASDVPGKVMQLYIEENVPVTMINTVRTYGTNGGKYPNTYKKDKIGLPTTKQLVFTY
jgi:hypothetical protein